MEKRIFTVVLIVMVFIISSISFSQSTPKEIFEKALEYYYKADYPNAIKFFTDYIDVNANDFNGYNYRGLSYQAQKNYPKAIEDFTRVITLGKQNSIGYINRGNTYFLKKLYTQALQDFNDAIKYTPGNINGYLGKYRVQIAKNDLAGALATTSSGISAVPLDARGYLARAWVQYIRKDTAAIFDNIEHAMYYDSSLIFTNTERELLFVKIQIYNSILDQLNREISRDPDGYLSYLARGFVYFLVNRYNESVADLKKSVELNKNKTEKFDMVMEKLIRAIKRLT